MMLDLEPSPSTYTTGTFPILPSHRSIYIISLHSRSREKRAGPFISPPPVRLTALATILRRLLLAAHTPPPLVRGRLVLRAAAATPAIGSCAVKLAGLTPFSSTGKGGGGGGGGGRWSNRAPGQQRHHRQQRLPKPRPDQHREQRQQWRPNPAQRPTTNMTTAEEAHKMGVGVGQKRDAAEPADPAGEGAADNAAAAAEAAREVQRKARDESHSKRMKRLLQTDPAAAERMEYRRRVGICCRDQDMAEAIRLFGDVKARGIDIGPEGFNSLLALCGAQGQAARLADVFEYMRAKGVPLSEAAYVSVLRVKALGGAPEEAERVMDEMLAAKQRPRLRSFSPLILGYAAKGQATQAFAAYDRMLSMGDNTAALEPTETELAALLRVAGAVGDEGLFLRALRDMQEVVLEPTAETWDAVESWFRGRQQQGEEVRITRPTRVRSDGGCAACGARLASVDLSREGCEELLAMVEEIVLQSEERRGDWATFRQWLSAAVAADAYDVVVDGANVGYYQMNYAGAPPHVNYEQIAWVMGYLHKAAKRPLLVLHARHVQEKRVPPQYRGLVRGWKDAGVLCTVPYKNNDDWFWLCATVARGGRTLVVTNDQMRDHHFQMLSRKTFLRWRERHQALFSIRGLLRDGGDAAGGGTRVVQVEEPPVFSRCIQGPAVEKEEVGGIVATTSRWHLPLAESQEWLCVVQTRREGKEGEGE